jgi:predicted nucleic acid-binding protein
VIVLDASVLIAYLNRDDAYSEEALWLLAEAAGKDTELLVNPVTLAEVLVAPTRVGRQDEVLRVVTDVGVRVAQFPPDAPTVLAELRCTGLKMPDCCVLLTALEQRAAVASFDERLRRAAADLDVRLVSREPTSPPRT